MLPQPAVAVALAGGGALSIVATWVWPGVAPPPPPSAWALAILFAGAIVVAYRYPVQVRQQTKVAMVTVVYYLLAILVSPPLAALGAGLGALAGEVSRRRISGAYPSDMASEAGRRALIVLVGALAAHTGGAHLSPPALLSTAFILAMLDALTIPLVLAPITGELPHQVLVATLRESAQAEGIQYIVGVIGAAAAISYPWTLALLAVPCALVYVSFKTMKEMHDGTRQLLENMADAVDLRDAYTGGHSRRVTEYSAAILRKLGLSGPEVDLIIAAARVHDIGKIGIPDAVLNKPGPLTPEERAVMEEHPVKGAELLKRHRDFARGIAIVRHHHESWDGAGYPDRLKGTAIPFGARVIAVADSFDAMTSDRPYRKGMSIQKAAGILRDGRGRQWDARLVDAFLRTISAELEQGATPPSEPAPAEQRPSLSLSA
jgi:putative nucleotidyltransferase with HDIG domain